ncbi:uncharacterized protein LOC141641393 [Silene latifolia]|uniref:uncharacterized protein LOC141641393 n=1 Tax=Silene latifolia TaxID=37657 RepID=UPI003D77EF65
MDGKHTKYPIFKGDNYSWWKHRMEHYVKSTDYECWVIIQKGPLAITVTDSDGKSVVKSEESYVEADYRKVKKNSKAMSILQYGIGEQDINRISGCTSAKEIWDTLNLAYEGTSQVKKHRLGREFDSEDIVRKILRSLSDKWQPKVTAIEEAKDLSKLSLNELMGSLMAHELSLAKRSGESSKARGFALKSTSSDEEDDGDDEQAMYSHKLCLMFDDVLDKSLAKNDKLYDLQTQIEEIAEENVGLRECLDEIKESNIIPSLKKEIKKLRKENLVLTNIASSSKSTVASTVVSDVEKENESLIIQVDILIKERDSLLADLTSCRHDNKQLEEIAMLLSDECSHAKSAFDKVGKLNLDHLAKIETLTKELHDAKEFYRKWEGSQNILDSLINRPKNQEKVDLVSKMIHESELRKPEPSKTDFRRRKYAGLPEYIVCNFCGISERRRIGTSTKGCSRHMTGSRNQFLSLEAYNGGTVTFGDNKKGEIIAIGKVDGNTREVVLEGKPVKDVYLTNLFALSSRTMSCMSALKKNDPWLWHKRLGHVNARTLNTLKRLDLVDDIPNMKFDFNSLCDDCAKGKQVRSSFKSKKSVSTSKPLELLHIDLCGPMRVRSKGEDDEDDEDYELGMIRHDMDDVHQENEQEEQNQQSDQSVDQGTAKRQGEQNHLNHKMRLQHPGGMRSNGKSKSKSTSKSKGSVGDDDMLKDLVGNKRRKRRGKTVSEATVVETELDTEKLNAVFNDDELFKEETVPKPKSEAKKVITRLTLRCGSHV